MVDFSNSPIYYARRRRQLAKQHAKVIGDLSRFDVPFEELLTHQWTTDEAWVYGTFFLNHDFEHIMAGPNIPSIKDIHEEGVGGIRERAAAVYAFTPKEAKPTFIWAETDAGYPHTFTAFRRGDRLGSLCCSVNRGLGRREPIYKSIELLLASYGKDTFSTWASFKLGKRGDILKYEISGVYLSPSGPEPDWREAI
jgi:hypothetical protein